MKTSRSTECPEDQGDAYLDANPENRLGKAEIPVMCLPANAPKARQSRIGDLKPYPKMKDSGVPWLGEVPEHWEGRRLKYTFQRIVGGSTPSSAEATYWDGDIVWVTPTDVSRNSHLKDSQRRITRVGLSACSTELVPSGSIVVTSRAPVGNVAIADVELCTNQGCKALVPALDIVHPTFGFHLLATLKGELQSLATGTTFTEISTSRMGDIRVPLPPLPEQTAIVRFLDYMDRRIRRYIRAKQKLIKLLEEQKQAIIHRAVTRGLDPNVRLKPSGVEWLGDVPEHWATASVKRSYAIQLGKMLQNRPEGPADTEVPYLKAQHVQWFSVRTSPVPKMWASPRDMKQFGIATGDLLVCEGGEGGRAGIVHAAPPGLIIQNALHRVRPHGQCLNEFLQYVMSAVSTTGWFDAINNKATIAHFPREKFGALRMPVPPLPEQAAITQSLDSATASLTSMTERTRGQIALLREYRTRLIADVVTGKLDVREAAARLPEETDAAEPPDEVEDDTEEAAETEDAMESEEMET